MYIFLYKNISPLLHLIPFLARSIIFMHVSCTLKHTQFISKEHDDIREDAYEYFWVYSPFSILVFQLMSDDMLIHSSFTPLLLPLLIHSSLPPLFV